MSKQDALAADLVLKNGRIVTVDPLNSVVEALAAKWGRILDVGTSGEIEHTIGPRTTVIDLQGRTVLPGFQDSHVHLVADLAEIRKTVVDCRDTYTDIRSIRDIQERMRQQAAKTPKDQWVIGNGAAMQDGRLKEHRFPTRRDLDEVVADHPAYVSFGAHRTVANSLALKLAGVTRDSKDPPAGHIVKDESGEPTGMLIERAQPLVTYLPVPGGKELVEEAVRSNRIIPQLPSRGGPSAFQDLKDTIVFIAQRCLESGVTTVHDNIVSAEEIRAYQEVYREGRLPVRVGLMLRAYESQIPAEALLKMGLTTGFGDDWLRIVGVKMSVDGGFSGRNAAFYDHYVGEPENYGMIRIQQETLNDLVMKLHRAGLRCVIHAMGDKALDMTLEAYEKAIKGHPRKDHRHRIEHQPHFLCLGERLEKIKELDLVCCPLTTFLGYLGDQAMECLGPERMKGAFPFSTYLREGVKLIDGTDAPGYWPIDVLRDVQFCVARKTWSGSVLNSGEALPVIDAIRMVTIDAAWASFEETTKGSIEPGKLADLVVLSEDPFSVPPENIGSIKVDFTIVGGRVSYERKGQKK